MSKVSVIIPVYNAEKYLRQCLDSVINQTLTDIEIICVDDGSTDDSLDILKEYAEKDNRIKIINYLNNSKQGYARNRALEIVGSSYVMFIDADDYVEQDIVEILLKKIENVDVVIANLGVFSEDDIDPEYSERFEKYYNEVAKDNGIYDFKGEFTSYRSGPVAKLFKKEIIDKYDIKFPEFLINEDEAFHWAYFSVINKICFINKKLYYRRVHNQSTMSKRDNEYYGATDMVKILEYIFKFLTETGLYKKYKKDFYPYFHWHKNLILDRCRKEEYLKVKKQLKKFEKKAGLQELKPLERIFSIKNVDNHKVVCILGIKTKIKRKYKGN